MDRTDAELGTRLAAATVFRRLVHVADCTSTMDLAAADAGDDDAVFWADHQTKGRGRQQRTWHDQQALDLAVTFRVRPHLPLPMALPAVMPLCVLEVLAARGAAGLRLKWPNDVFVQDRKIAGVLIDADAGRSGRHHIGIGINVNSERVAAEVAALATSLRLVTGRAHDRGALLLDLAVQLDCALVAIARGEVAEYEARYRRHLGLMDHRVVVRAGGEVRGVLQALDFTAITLADGRSIPLGQIQELRAE